VYNDILHMNKKYTADSFSWPSVISLSWYLMDEISSRGLSLDWRTCVELFGPGGFEVATRDPEKQTSFLKMIPEIITISTKYLEYGGKVDEWFLNTVSASMFAAKQDQSFADALSGSGETMSKVNWASVSTSASKLLYIFSRKLAQQKSTLHSAHFLQSFVMYARQTLTQKEEQILSGLEFQSGLGIFSAICSAKKVLPDLRPEELAGAMIKKYGIPDSSQLPSCSWCGGIPCRCDGRKATLRQVTEDDVVRYITKITPWHTAHCMELSYGLARNAGIGGDGYGPARVGYERAEAVVAKLFMQAHGDPGQLASMFGPLFIEQQRQFGRYKEKGDVGEYRARYDLVGELGDTIQWLFLILSGKIDHAQGLLQALKHVAQNLDVQLILPVLPELSLPPLRDSDVKSS